MDSPARGHSALEGLRPRANGRTEAELGAVGNQLQILLGRMTRRLRQAHVPEETSLSALTVLSLLESEGPLGCTELAARERITPQAVSSLLGTLERQGLVARALHEQDARRTDLSVTARGRELLAGQRSRAATAVAQAIDNALDDTEIRQLLGCLPLLQRVVDQL